MEDKNKTDQYVEYINKHILPFIDYFELKKSYQTDMVYAKGALNCLHEAMVKMYGSEQLDENSGDGGIVVIPGVVRGKESGKICVVLLDIDISSSGEHWGTTFLCGHGVINQNQAYSKSPDAAEFRKAITPYTPYDYCYTAKIHGDIHIDKFLLPAEIKDVLKDFRNHTGEKPSVLDEIRDRVKTPKEPVKDKKTSKKSEPDL